MDTFRCPTCLTLLLEGGEVRCPACNSKLRKRRNQPIILGESTRLTSRPMPWDRELQQRADAVFGADNRGREQLAQVASIRRVETASEPVLEPTPAPEPTRPTLVPTLPAVTAELVFEREPEPEPSPEPQPEVAIDLPAEHAADLLAAFVAEPTPQPTVVPEPTAAPEPVAAPEPARHLRPAPAPAPRRVPLGDPSKLDGAVNDMVAELYRKARADKDGK